MEQTEELERVKDIVVNLALGMGGTSTGEHGVGSGKRKFLEPEVGEVGVRLMCAIKRAVDPRGTFSPGNILTSCPPLL